MNLKKVKAMALATTMMVAALGSTSAFAAGQAKNSGETKVKTYLKRNVYTLTIPSVITINQDPTVTSATAKISVKSDKKQPIEIYNDVEVGADAKTKDNDGNWSLKRMTNRLRYKSENTVDGGYTTEPTDWGGIPFEIKQGNTNLNGGKITFSAGYNDKADLYEGINGQEKEIVTSIGEAEKVSPYWMEGDYEGVVTFAANVVRNRANDKAGSKGGTYWDWNKWQWVNGKTVDDIQNDEATVNKK